MQSKQWIFASCALLGLLAAPAWTQLQGEYYDSDVAGEFSTFIFSKLEAEINSDYWDAFGPCDPDSSACAGHTGSGRFAVRWRGQVLIPTTGSYTFHTEADDGVRLWLDRDPETESPQIDEWHTGYGNYATPPQMLVGGKKYDLVMEFFEDTSYYRIKLYWEGPGIAKSILPLEQLFPPVHGLRADFFNKTTGAYIEEDFSNTIHVKTRFDRTVDIRNDFIEPAVNDDQFGIIWRGQMQALHSGITDFKIEIDDGAIFFVNGVQYPLCLGPPSSCGDSWQHNTWWQPYYTKLVLTAGQFYNIEVRFREGIGEVNCVLFWKFPGATVWEVIPEEQLYTYQNENPTDILLSNRSVDENAPGLTTIGQLSTIDPNDGEDFAYTLVSGSGSEDNAAFVIEDDLLKTAGGASVNFEAQSSYSIRIRTTETGLFPDALFYEKVFVIAVNDLNEVPSALTITPSELDEGAGVGALVGQFTTTDPDWGQSHSYVLTSGAGDADNGQFNISGDFLYSSRDFDYESGDASFAVRVRVTDSGTNPQAYWLEETFLIGVNDVNEAPTDISLDSSTVLANAGVNAPIGNLSTTDPDSGQSHVYSLISGAGDTDNALFGINGTVLEALDNLSFSQPGYSIRIRSTEVGTSELYYREEIFLITEQDPGTGSQGATELTLSNSDLEENAGADALVGLLETLDVKVERSYHYTIDPALVDNAFFNLEGNALRANASFDYENGPHFHTVRLRSTDNGTPPFWIEEDFQVEIINVNDAPSDLVLGGASIAENAGDDAVVGVLSTLDQDDGQSHTYLLVSGEGDTNNDLFRIESGHLHARHSLDYEALASDLSIRIRTTDDGLPSRSREEVFSIALKNVDEAPYELSLDSQTIIENAGDNATVGLLTTADPDVGQSHIYALAAGSGDTDNDLFTINGNALCAKEGLDFETQSIRYVRICTMVNSEDPPSLRLEKAFTIHINDQNELPYDLALSNASVDENVCEALPIGTFSCSDPDLGQSHVYELVMGEGDDDNISFSILDAGLYLERSQDFETQSSCSIRVACTDNGSPQLTSETVFTIQVNDLNEAPTELILSNASIDNAAGHAQRVGAFTTIDPDSGQSHICSLTAGQADNNLFVIGGAASDALWSIPNFDIARSGRTAFSIVVRTTDDGLNPPNQYREETFYLSLIGAASPTFTVPTLDSVSVDENGVIGALVGLLGVNASSTGDSITYSLEEDIWYPGEHLFFSIDGDALRTTQCFDYETQSTYHLVIRATSNSDPSYSRTKSFSITVNDLNEAPSGLVLSAAIVMENAGEDVLIGSLSSTDPDNVSLPQQSHAYDLVAGAGDEDNPSFYITDERLYAANDFDFESAASAMMQVRIRSTDDGAPSLYREESFAITVQDVNEAPTQISLDNAAIDENALPGTLVGTLSTVDEDNGQSHSYILPTGAADNAFFSIDQANLYVNQAFDFEAQDSYLCLIRSTDSGAPELSRDQAFVISVNDVNEAPTAIFLSNASLPPTAGAYYSVGSFYTDDPDAGQMHGYILVAGPGDTDNGLFSIYNDSLRTGAAFDANAQTSFSIRVRSVDTGAGNLFCEEIFTIVVDTTLRAPRIQAVDDLTITEGSVYQKTPRLTQGTPPVTWALISGPQTMLIDADSGELTWTADAGESPATVTISAANAVGTDTASWTITVVAATDDTPLIHPMEDAWLEDGEVYSVTPLLERGARPVVWTLEEPIFPPGDMALDWASGALTWTADIAESPITVRLRATNASGWDEESWTLHVLTTGVAPEIAPIEDALVAHGLTYWKSPVLNAGTHPLTWSLIAPFPVPGDMAINSSTGTLSWTANIAQSPVDITVRAENGSGSDQESWRLTVAAAPLIDAVSDVSVVAGSAYTLTPTLLQGTAPLSWTLLEGPGAMSLDPNSGEVSWLTTLAESPAWVRLEASNAVGADEEVWKITVVPMPVAPQIEIVSDQFVPHEADYAFTPTLIEGTYPLSWTLVAPNPAPPGMAIDPDTGMISWTADMAQSPVDMVVGALNSAGYDEVAWRLNVLPALAFTKEPSGEITKGLHSSVAFEVAVTGGIGAIHYQWYQIPATKEWQRVPVGFDAPLLELKELEFSDEGGYFCQVWDESDTLIESSQVTLYVVVAIPVAGFFAVLLLALLLALLGGRRFSKRTA